MSGSQASPYTKGGKNHIGTTVGSKGSSGYKKPGYSGTDRARSSSKGTASKQASPYRPGSKGSGGAKAGNGPKNRMPGQGPIPSGSVAGAQSYPTRNSAKRQDQSSVAKSGGTERSISSGRLSPRHSNHGTQSY